MGERDSGRDKGERERERDACQVFTCAIIISKMKYWHEIYTIQK